MSTSREGVNPLRPYYIPPTIGERSEVISSPSPNPFGTSNATKSLNYASKARDVLTDIDYNDYLGDTSPTVVQNVKDFIDELIWKYSSILMAQPFEVAKIILQVRDQDEKAALTSPTGTDMLKKKTSSHGGSIYDMGESDSEGDEQSFFTSNMPETPTPLHPKSRQRNRSVSPAKSQTLKTPTISENYLDIRRPDSLMGVCSALWQKEGIWGVWKGTNATFLYTVLQSVLENWSRSFLSAIFNVPDLGVKEDIDRLVDIASPYPWASLFVAATAAVATGVLLAPLDLVRTRLVMTPSSRGQRRTLATLRALPSYFCNSLVLLPTMLHSLIHPILTLSTPLVLRTRFMIDSQASPTTFSFVKFCASSAAIFVKLPLETSLRRGHMAVLSSGEYLQALSPKDQKLDTIVPVGKYDGVFGTMYHIAREEGQREVVAKAPPARRNRAKFKTGTPAYQKGQGVEGLWRGWKVNWWGLVGLWTASVFGNGGDGEF
ncbi:unnamed protein product [Clonostachys chloroleuca]|uniref:Mitochondrial fusion and transport protein ugo1 n=1 Tax=Clonostachys chloroleuca TaxID=1926264 RepID=A0AA35MFW0_9HYPO|nr:unnamed protein product [Clonostachys chloroleuca]